MKCNKADANLTFRLKETDTLGWSKCPMCNKIGKEYDNKTSWRHVKWSTVDYGYGPQRQSNTTYCRIGKK